MMQVAVQGVRKWQLYSITEHVNAYFRTILYLAEIVYYMPERIYNSLNMSI